jgi:adenylate kinase family enzyme
MTNYYYKYLKYKTKYKNLKNNINLDDYSNESIQDNELDYNLVGGNNKLIIHISGTQGSGKSTLGDKLLKKYKNKINIFDLDNLQNDYMNTSNKTNYQDFLNNIIEKHKNKPIIFVGLDAELCLGLMEDSDVMYDLDADYNFYIETSDNTLKQRFFRQINKLQSRKEWFFGEWTKSPKTIQNKLFRFVDLNKWKENNNKCDKLYLNRKYKFMDSNKIFTKVCKIIERKNNK